MGCAFVTSLAWNAPPRYMSWFAGSAISSWHERLGSNLLRAVDPEPWLRRWWFQRASQMMLVASSGGQTSIHRCAPCLGPIPVVSLAAMSAWNRICLVWSIQSSGCADGGSRERSKWCYCRRVVANAARCPFYFPPTHYQVSLGLSMCYHTMRTGPQRVHPTDSQVLSK